MLKVNVGGITNTLIELTKSQREAIQKGLPEIAEMFRSSIDFNFRKGGRYGSGILGGGKNKWKISVRAKEQSGQTLVDTRRLANSIEVQINGKKIVIGSNTKYARIHQYGGIIKAKNKKGLVFNIGGKFVIKKQVTIPARPYLVLQDSDIKIAKEIIQSYIKTR